MRRTILITMLSVLGAMPVMAENTQDNRALCAFLPVKEVPSGADYVPGVDVHGNEVVAADVNAGAGAKGYVDVIRIPVTVDLAQNLTQSLPQGTEMDAQVAMIEIYKDSRVVMNGHDVTQAAYTHCGKTPLDVETTEAKVEKRVEVNPAPGPVSEQMQEDLPLPIEAEEKETIIWGEAY